VKLKPLRDNVLVKLRPPADMVGGLHVPEMAQERSLIGEVLAVGQGRHFDGDETRPSGWITTDVVPGNVVLIGKHGGHEIEIEGEKYWVMSEDDILGVVEEA
jgi:chaperonin GroES